MRSSRRSHALVVALLLSLGWLSYQAGVAAQATSGGSSSRLPIEPTQPVDLDHVLPETYRAHATSLSPGEVVKIDGRLDDDVWSRAERHGHFVQRDPAAGFPASEATEFAVAYDTTHLYFAIWCFDSDYHGISASELKRDASLKKGDQVKIIVDPFHDRRNGFFFSTNPLGAFKDSHQIDNGRTVNMDWNAVWEVKTTVDVHGWYAEFAIPFGQLRFKGAPGAQTWGLNVCRVIVRRNEDSYWVPFPRQWGTPGFSRVASAGMLDGFTDLAARRRFEAVPYLSPVASQNTRAGESTTGDVRAGFDVRVGVTSTMNADVTYRTDFAQVEADEETVNLSRFALMFPEKRQFFSEPAGLFGYGAPSERESNVSPTGPQEPGLLQLYYSRRIGQTADLDVPIRLGARLTGRAGAYQVGVMDVQTDSSPARFGSTEPARGDNFSVVRVRRDLFGKSSIGAIFLNRESGGSGGFNRTAGADLNLTFGTRLMMTGLIGKTFSPGPEGQAVAYALDSVYKSDRWVGGASYVDIPEHFKAEMGFIRRTDIRNLRGKLGWTPRPGWTGVRQLAFTGLGEAFENHEGTLVSRRETADFMATFDDSSILQVTLLDDLDRLESAWGPGSIRFAAGAYGWRTLKAQYTSNQSKPLSGILGVETGGYYGGDRRTYKIVANINPFRTFLLETTYQRNRVTMPGEPAYAATTLSNRISYSFSPELYLKSFVQYNSDRRLATANLLLWYIYRPGSDIYVVYNQGWDTDLPFGRFAQIRDRSLTVKLTFWVAR